MGPLLWPRVRLGQWRGYRSETVNGHTSVCLSVPMRHDTCLGGGFMLKITNRAM